MQITIRFFATLRDRVGKDKVSLTLSEPATVGSMLKELSKQHPAIIPSLPSALVAVNHTYAFPDEPLHEGDEVGLFPPVSGGSGEEAAPPEYFAITSETLNIDEIVGQITRPDTGGVCVFTGAVRGLTWQEGDPLETDHLVYEAYQPMAEKMLRQIAQEIRQKFPLVKGIAIVQRTGTLTVGETTVLVACSAGHRTDGIFEAARYGIDRLKEIVPVWKKEVGPDGSSWIEGDYLPTPDDRAPEA